MKALLVSLLLVVSSSAMADNRVWVFVTTADQGGREEFQGLVDKGIYERFRSGQYNQEFLLLENLFFYDQSANMFFLDGLERSGRSYGYDSDMYIRVSTILRFGLMDQDMIQARLEEKKLGVRARRDNCSP